MRFDSNFTLHKLLSLSRFKYTLKRVYLVSTCTVYKIEGLLSKISFKRIWYVFRNHIPFSRRYNNKLRVYQNNSRWNLLSFGWKAFVWKLRSPFVISLHERKSNFVRFSITVACETTETKEDDFVFQKFN